MGLCADHSLEERNTAVSRQIALVTGGAGFIGRRLGTALRQRGYFVRSLDATQSVPDTSADEWVNAHICDKAAVEQAVRGTDVVLHLAAKHRFFGVSPEEFRQVNVDGTKVLVDAARKTGVRDIVFFSSVAVYGDCDSATHEDLECRPENPYGRTKFEAESVLRAWAGEDPDRRLIVIRPTVVFGPGNRGNVYRLMRQVNWHLYVQVGAGENVKSVAYVENLVAATLFLMDSVGSGIDTFNYADEPHVPFRTFVETVYRQLGRTRLPLTLPVAPVAAVARPLEALARLVKIDLPIGAALAKMNKSTHHSSAKLRSLGYRQPWSTEEGLERMAEWFRAR
jgi:GlcNAc-P-P-Und epimerase